MNEKIRQKLLELNRHFYTTVAPDFDQTRQGWTPGLTRLLDYVPRLPVGQTLTVLDAGCGNGRFARMVDSLGLPFMYVGVDGSEKLLALAQTNTADLQYGTAHFYQADLAEPGWTEGIDPLPASPFLRHAQEPAGRGFERRANSLPSRGGPERGFDFVLCTATLQHLPGYALRQRLVRDLAALTGQVLALSAWQFLTAERFRTRLIPWSEIGLTAADVAPGDALLPWKQGQFAVRYVHQLDAAELGQMAADGGLRIVKQFRADGKEGDLNLYMVLAS